MKFANQPVARRVVIQIPAFSPTRVFASLLSASYVFFELPFDDFFDDPFFAPLLLARVFADAD